MLFNPLDILDDHLQVPSSLSDELKLPTNRKTKRLDDLVRNACNGEFHMKKYIAKDSEQFLQVNRSSFVNSRHKSLLAFVQYEI